MWVISIQPLLNNSLSLNYIREEALVIALENDVAWVQTQNKQTCASCQVNDTCGNGIIERFFAGRMFNTPVKNTLNAKVGDRLEIAILKSKLTTASLIVYLLPIGLLLLAATLAFLFDFSENGVIVIGLSGLVAGLGIARLFNQRVANNQQYQAQMLKLVVTTIVNQTLLKRPQDQAIPIKYS